MIMLAFVVLGLFALRRLSVDEVSLTSTSRSLPSPTWPGAGP